MPIINMETGKVLVTDKQLIKGLKKWLANCSNKEWCKKLEKENARIEKGDK